MKLLVIDDDADHRTILSDLFGDLGHTVESAADGACAMELLGSLPDVALPDVIILDWMMPNVDGLAFRQQQRANARLAHIPVVLMTAASQARIPMAEIAPDAEVPKPVQLEELLSTLDQVVARARKLGA